MSTLVIDEVTEQRALCIDPYQSEWAAAMKNAFLQKATAVISVAQPGATLNHYDYIVLCICGEKGEGNSPQLYLPQLIEAARTARVLIMTDDEHVFNAILSEPDIKVDKKIKVVLVGTQPTPEMLEKIMWFYVSHSTEQHLRTASHMKPAKNLSDNKMKTTKKKHFKLTRKKIIFICLYIFLFVNLFFWIPLTMTAFSLSKLSGYVQSAELGKAQQEAATSRSLFQLTRASYAVAKPMWQFFFISFLPDRLMTLEESTITFSEAALSTAVAANKLLSYTLSGQGVPGRAMADGNLLTSQSPTETDIANTIRQLRDGAAAMESSSGLLKDTLTFSHPKIQALRHQFETINQSIHSLRPLINHVDELLAKDTKKTYLIFFYNNMELRPGGGFLGSFALINLDNMKLTDFTVYDVYDADGQLTEHIEPPKAIRQHLNQIHWFLRDSNFSPDFAKNVQTAEFFLRKEMNITKIDGAIGLTTTALSYVLEGFGTVHIPDYNESINKDNFYITTQTHAEDKFFGGSTQKKNFLSSVGRALILKSQEASPVLLAKALQKSLQEKHLVLNLKDPTLQSIIEGNSWGGRNVTPPCVASEACLINTIVQFDANLGVNKVNYYIDTSAVSNLRISEEGIVTSELEYTYQNTSPSQDALTSTYKNYFQIYLPKDIRLQAISIDGITRQDYDIETTDDTTAIGLYHEVAPSTTSVIRLSYSFDKQLQQGKTTLQTVIQKQIGADNSNFVFTIDLPKNIYLANQNFASLAKNNKVFYNNTLSTDKIFLVDVVKE